MPRHRDPYPTNTIGQDRDLDLSNAREVGEPLRELPQVFPANENARGRWGPEISGPCGPFRGDSTDVDLSDRQLIIACLMWLPGVTANFLWGPTLPASPCSVPQCTSEVLPHTDPSIYTYPHGTHIAKMLVQCWVKVADGGPRLSRYFNFHRDPQLQVGQNYSYVFNLNPNICRTWMFKHTLNSQHLWFNLPVKYFKNDFSRDKRWKGLEYNIIDVLLT